MRNELPHENSLERIPANFDAATEIGAQANEVWSKLKRDECFYAESRSSALQQVYVADAVKHITANHGQECGGTNAEAKLAVSDSRSSWQSI